jgi:hypothetical protein
MAIHIRRRDFITLLGGAAAERGARSSQAMPVIGFLRSTSPEGIEHVARRSAQQRACSTITDDPKHYVLRAEPSTNPVACFRQWASHGKP